MKNVFRFTFFLFVIPTLLFGQERVMYTSKFQFQNGIYLSFQDFKNNNPIPLTYILSDNDIRSANYIDLVLEADTVTYFDNLYQERVVATHTIWGYAKGGKPFIGYNRSGDEHNYHDRGWFPILLVGAYCYYSAITTVTRTVIPTPGVRLGDNSMFSYDGMSKEVVSVHLLLDFSSGETIELETGELTSISLKLMEQLLASDGELLAQYAEQPRREQKQSSMFYISRFNERHPISFPAY